ncbi:putative Kinase-like domain-containing protein [Seiridium cardinale]
MAFFKLLCCGLPKTRRPHSPEAQEHDIFIPGVNENPPQIQLSSFGESQLTIPKPAISEHLSVYSQHAAHPHPSQRPYKLLPLDVKLEEETNPGYRPDTWYHVRIGEIIQERYQICTKLGWGDTSTVWLANDLRNTRYVSIKVCANPQDQRVRELDFLLHITTLYSNHPGAQNVTTLLDHFRIRRNNYTYLCLVTDVLGPNLCAQVPATLRRLDIDWVKEQLYRLLQAVDFLHSVAYVVHGDIRPPNVLCAIQDRHALHELDELESQQPSDRKIDGDRVIYVSRAAKYQSSHMPVLIDFGNSRLSTAAAGVECTRALRESVNLGDDEPLRPQRDLQWVGSLFIGMIEGRTLYKVVLVLPERQPSTAAEVDAHEKEKRQLLRFLWRMKNSDAAANGAASITGSRSRHGEELTAKKLLRDPIFVDPEHRYHHTW